MRSRTTAARKQPRTLVLGNDASWGGWGWCLADQHGPLQVGHLALGPPRRRASKTKANPYPKLLATHRLQRFKQYLHGPLALVLADAQLLRRPSDPLVRVVVEVPPLGFKSGKASAYVAVGRMVGAIEVWGCRPSLATPWVQEPGEWRGYWRIPPSGRGRGSAQLKADAITLATSLWGRKWLEPFNRTAKGGPRGDVAEAMLLTVRSCRDQTGAPETPTTWPGVPAGLEFGP